MQDSNVNIKVDLKLLAGFLILTNILTLVLWMPWSGSSDDAQKRTIETSGRATLQAEPDEFVFYPSYEFTASSTDEVNSLIAEKSGAVIAGLKDIGVVDKDISNNASNYENYWDTDSDQFRGYVSINVTADSRDFAQTISDYLLTTSPQGSVTPQAQFSEAKQKELEAEARSAAIADARSNAERTARDLGVSLGSVRTVSDSPGASFPWIGYGRAEIALDSAVSSPSIAVQPGQNDLSFSVDVTFDVD